MNTGDQAPKPIRVAVIGCGAVTEQFHLPVLAGHQDVAVVALVDPDTTRARRLAALYRVPTTLASADEIDHRLADAALIATPPFLHANGAITLMRRGLHVLVEKPLALTCEDGDRVVATAREEGVALSVGLFRRLTPAIRLFRSAVDAGEIGQIQRVDAEVGSAYTWQLTTMAGMRRDQGGGGILVDMGSHVLDLIVYLFNSVPIVVDYQDNASAGIETDCTIHLRLRRGTLDVPVRVELSRTRTLRNTIRAEGSAGAIEWTFGDRERLRFESPRTFVDTVTGAPRPCHIEARWLDEAEQFGYEGFRTQVDDWIGAMRRGGDPQLSGQSAMPSVRLIEQCYARRTPLEEPWFTEGLPRARDLNTPAVSRERRVLVTGASGFIGCRLSERLHFGSPWQVRALIRNAGRAVRLARMPIEFAIGDLLSDGDLTRALEGCDAVVHGGIGTSWRTSERVATTVQGTRKLVAAAERAGVKRFVHLSTIALHGDKVAGTITEDTPVNPKKGWDYAESKLAAERIVLEAAARGLSAVVLRIAVVYGPHNMTVVARPLEHLSKGRLFLVECREVPANTIYVDNLCHAIQLALDAPNSINGQTFLLSDDDGLTWGEYYDYFASRIGATVRHVARAATQAPARSPGALSRWYGGTHDLATSPEAKALAKRVYNSTPWGTPARWFVETFPGAVDRLKQRLRPDEAFVYRPRPASDPGLPPFTVDPIAARVSAEKARRVMGFAPIVPTDRALALTLAWAQYSRIVPCPAHDEMAAVL